MFVKFNYNNTIRKTKMDTLSAKALIEKFETLFETTGSQDKKVKLFYQDFEDDDYVQIIDESDIESCIFQREENNIQSALKIFAYDNDDYKLAQNNRVSAPGEVKEVNKQMSDSAKDDFSSSLSSSSSHSSNIKDKHDTS